MVDPAAEPPVLNYAPPSWVPLSVWAWLAVRYVIFGLLGAAAGYLISPATKYRSEGEFEISAFTAINVSTAPTALQIEAKRNIDGMRAPAHLSQAATQLKSQGISISAAELANRVTFDHPTGRFLIKVSVTDREPQAATNIVTAVMQGFPYRLSPPDPNFGQGVQLINSGEIATPVTYWLAFSAGGFFLGLLLCGFTLRDRTAR